MSGRSIFVALAFLACVLAPVKSLAQNAGDAGVSGIPHGPGSVGGLNNTINDPSGVGNAARIQPPPPPSMAAPVVPSSPVVTSRPSPSYGPVRKLRPRAEAVSHRRRESRRARGAARGEEKLLDRKMNICKGC
jgi:hypothetical protein